MMEVRCIVVGAGYAGINVVNTLLKANRQNVDGRKLRLILIDKQPYHLRKVLLFKSAAGDSEITVPWEDMFPSGVQFIQGTVTTVAKDAKMLTYHDPAGSEHALDYDILIMAVGSIVRKPDPIQGGIALTGVEAAKQIRSVWHANMIQAVKESDKEERKRLLTIAVAGAGISGIETSAELAHAMRQAAKLQGIDPAAVNVYLLNAQDRLFREGPDKVGRKLERSLSDIGVTVLHSVKALKENEGRLALSNGEILSIGLCVWTLGLIPNPATQSFGLPITTDGRLKVDECYRVNGSLGIYSIGDCARIADPVNGQQDRMTCKEAVAQATRLAKIVTADLEGRSAPVHKKHMDLFCFGLGPDRGMVWTRQWGLDIIIGGKLGWKIRKLTWDTASLMR